MDMESSAPSSLGQLGSMEHSWQTSSIGRAFKALASAMVRKMLVSFHRLILRMCNQLCAVHGTVNTGSQYTDHRHLQTIWTAASRRSISGFLMWLGISFLSFTSPK